MIVLRRQIALLKRWWAINPSVTRWLPRCVNKWLQYWGERYRSAKAHRESEDALPFPYSSSWYLESYCYNRKAAEPDFEAYWREQQRLVDLAYAYRKTKLLQGKGPEFTLHD